MSCFLILIYACTLFVLNNTTPLKRSNQSNEGFIPEGYNFTIRTNDTARIESGTFEKDGRQENSISGSYAYETPDGMLVEVSYTANGKGFVPKVKILLKTQSKNEGSFESFIGGPALGSLLGGNVS